MAFSNGFRFFFRMALGLFQMDAYKIQMDAYKIQMDAYKIQMDAYKMMKWRSNALKLKCTYDIFKWVQGSFK